MDDQMVNFVKMLALYENQANSLIERVKKLEEISNGLKPTDPVSLNEVAKITAAAEEDDNVDLFESESKKAEKAAEVHQKHLADYAVEESNKPVLITKSNIILDITPRDDETDMKRMEEAVRAIQTKGLLWGAAKLVPLASGKSTLEISSVVENELVSIDWLQNQIEEISDYVQSVAFAAFNKV